MPSERTEAILHGLVEAFHFFGCVPQELWWDNPKSVAIDIFAGRERRLHPRYAALASHYAFVPKFCMPATATEKPRVENRVFDLERQWATPVPQVCHLAALNAHLRECCLQARQRTCGQQAETVAARYEHDRASALEMPRFSFEACVHQPGQVDKFQTVGFDTNRYSVPRRDAFREVTIKGFVDRGEIVRDGVVIARHERCYDRKQRRLDPLHFLETLRRKPAALDHARVFRDWNLPAIIATCRQALESQLGKSKGSQRYIEVLHLLHRHPPSRLAEALVACLSRGLLDVSAITSAVERLESDIQMSLPTRLGVQVPMPDLSRFNQFLTTFPTTISKGESNVPNDTVVAQGESQAIEAANDVGRV